MRGRKGFFSLFTSLPEHQETKTNDVIRRRRRHSSGDRETWSRKVEYFFAGLGYAVGLGNIWRFPYLCYRNGGGAFLVPYFLILIVVGFPMLLLEMGIGQFASLGPVTIWRISPLFKGIGYAIVVILLLMNTYYNVLIAYALFYMFASITNELPWARCNNLWNTENCIESRYDGPSNKSGAADTSNVVGPAYDHMNESSNLRHLLKTPTEEFFENHLLHMSSGIDQVGSLQWPLIVCLGVSWFTCFMCLYKGIKSMGKAVIFTTIFSYAILAVLLIRGVTLKGSAEGIIYYLKPDFRKLANLQVWGEASAQALMSLSLGGGGWITLSSYNKFKNRCDRDAWLVGLGNALTSLFAGFVIFSVLGHMAYKKDVPVEKVTASGPGLAFVAYPEGLALIPFAPFWAVCFFFMMFTVGLDSLFGQVESIASGIIDEYPDYLRPRRKMFTLFLCSVMFFMGMPLVTEGGMYMVTLIDWYILLFSFTIVCLSEIIAIVYVYGYEKFAHDMEMMLGKKPSLYYMVSWRAITPLSLVGVIILLAACYVPPYYGSYTFPTYAKTIGWILAFGPVSLIPLTMLWQFCRRVGSFQTLKDMVDDPDTRREVTARMTSPTMDWGPALPENFRKYSVDRNLHTAVANVELGDDEVFGGGTELADLRHGSPDEKVHLVHFKDKVDVEGEQGQGDTSTKEQGQGDASTKEQGQGDGGTKEQGQSDASTKEQGQGDVGEKEKGQGDAKGEGQGDKDAVRTAETGEGDK